jgi:hypothetical protein
MEFHKWMRLTWMKIVQGWENSLIKFTTWITRGTCMEINGWIWIHIKMDGNDHRKHVWISFTWPTTFMSSTSLTKFHQFGKNFICLINCIHVVYDINVIHMIIFFHHYFINVVKFIRDLILPIHRHIKELPMLPTLCLGKMCQNMILICHMSQIQTSQHKFRIRSMAS